MHFYQHLKVLYLCGFHGGPTFLSYILPEMNVLNTCAKFEVKISVQNEWQHEPLTIYNTRPPNGSRACAAAERRLDGAAERPAHLYSSI